MPTAVSEYKPLNLRNARGETRVKEGYVISSAAGEYEEYSVKVVRRTDRRGDRYDLYIANPVFGVFPFAFVDKHSVGIWRIYHRNDDGTYDRHGLDEHGTLAQAVERAAQDHLHGLAYRAESDERSKRLAAYKVNTDQVQSRLSEFGISAVRTADSTSDDIQIYLTTPRTTVLRIDTDGVIEVVSFDATGGVSSEIDIATGRDVEDTVHKVRLWLKQYDLQQRAQALLDFLHEEVPAGVAHFAVEGAKRPLRQLISNAFTVDMLYGEPIVVTEEG